MKKVKQYIKYKVELVYADSSHELASYVEDEEGLFITSGDSWWTADDFFSIKDIKEFLVVVQ